ncbi:autotransporter outer membrane beta-barrel domain-containing protein [Methylobacterium segetis]|uniref:autotransporter outer membrane beta-barrel domain-containing protein n=1 Tax=Methylobacterium segetis TaxID=2488750 RepID=UPI001042BB74|nr:autotransporter outer membrane beta-barrel domain-containing protein [Methylobacterium segetis]
MSVPVWAVLVADGRADCQPATPASNQTVTCTGNQPTGFIAPAGATGLTVNIQSGATIGFQQTSAGNNPSFANVRVNGSSTVNNAGTISNAAPLNRDNFGVNLAGDLSTLNNTGTITLTAPAGNATTRVYGAYSSAPTGAEYDAITVTNSGTISVTQNGNGVARGVYSGEDIEVFTLNNTGLIQATRGTTATATTAAVAGVDADDDTDKLVVNNAASGRILATGTNTRALNGRAAEYEINNRGTIGNTTAGEAAIATYALNAGNAGATTARAYNTVITNTATGVINGDVRNTDQDLQTAATVVNIRRTGTLNNAGLITGNVSFGGGNQTVNNTGRIGGNITFLDVAGTVNTVNLGTGSSIGGNITAQGLGTNALNLSGTDTLTGTVSGFTSLTQNAGAWTLGSGSVQNLSGNLTVAGGNLTLAAGSTQNVGGQIQVTGSGAQLTVNNTITNKTVLMSGSNTTVVNNGTLTGTGAAGRPNTAATRVYGVLANSNAGDISNLTVVNTGTISVTENGIGISRGVYAGEDIASMTVTNTGRISATRAATSTGTAAVAAIDSDDDVAALTVNNRAGGQITGTGTGVRAVQGRARNYTLVNEGTITGPAGGQAIVIFGAGNATLTNAASGTITGDVRLVDADSANPTNNRRNSTTVNAGRVAGNVVYGAGSHTLTNTGTITGAITFNDVAASVNTVNLGTGSVIGGTITAQGRGTNSLNLSGTGTLASDVVGFTSLSQASGAYTLAAGTTQGFSGGASVTGGTLTVNSTLNAATRVGGAGTLSGTGTIGGSLTNAGTVAPGNAAAPTGTLNVAGAYVQGAGGTLQSTIAPEGQAARLAVTGAATLDGTVQVKPIAGSYLPGTRYTVLTAQGGVRGAFAAAADDGTLPFLIRPLASHDANNAYVTLTQQSFALVAQTPNQASAARGLDAALASNPAALLALDSQSNAALAGVLDRAAGQGYASMADPQLRAGRAFTDQLVSRAYVATFEPGPTQFTLPPAVYAADLPKRGPVPEPKIIETSRGYGVWANGYGQFGRVENTLNAAGRNETIAGFAGGIDIHPQVGTVLGVSAGYGSVDVSLGRTGERAHTDNGQVGVYGGITNGALYANAALGYARAEGRLDRAPVFAALQGNGARGTISGNQFLSAGEAGYRFTYAPGQVLTPFVGFQVSTFDQDRVREAGGGLFNLNVAARDFLSARTLVGGRFESSATIGGRVVTLAFKAAYVHDFADVSRTISSAFALAPAVPFAVAGRRLDRDRALIGLGIGTLLAPGLTGFVNYDAEVASTDSIQAVRGGLRYNF